MTTEQGRIGRSVALRRGRPFTWEGGQAHDPSAAPSRHTDGAASFSASVPKRVHHALGLHMENFQRARLWPLVDNRPPRESHRGGGAVPPEIRPELSRGASRAAVLARRHPRLHHRHVDLELVARPGQGSARELRDHALESTGITFTSGFRRSARRRCSSATTSDPASIAEAAGGSGTIRYTVPFPMLVT